MNVPYERSFASHSKSKFWSNKNTLKTHEVYKGATQKFYFNCDICKHEFYSSLNSITTNNSWCPFCVSQKLCNDENCKECFNKSFASHNKAKLWSSKNILTSRQISKNSNKKFLFDCDKCIHTYCTSLNNINKNGCVYCAKQKLCDDKNCKECFNLSFATHDKVKFWSDENVLSPRNVFMQSNVKFIFNCDKCNHSFSASLNHIYGNRWCSYCSNKILCKKNDCNICYYKSFKSNIKSDFWSTKNVLTPREVFKSTAKKYFFDCNICNCEFLVCLYQITNTNSWCPICKRKTELKLFNHLKSNFDNDVEREVKFPWSKTEKSYLRYDFVIEKIKLIIELDGNQHFVQVSNWSTPEHNKINDNIKNNLAIENNYNIIRISQEMVLFDKENWIDELNNTISLLNKKHSVFYIGNIYN